MRTTDRHLFRIVAEVENERGGCASKGERERADLMALLAAAVLVALIVVPLAFAIFGAK